MASIKGIPQKLPPPQPVSTARGLTLVSPITRRGYGPGLIVLVDQPSSGLSIRNGVPSPLQKWAEEGFCVIEVLHRACEDHGQLLRTAISELEKNDKCEANNGIGLVCYDQDGWRLFAPHLLDIPQIKGAVLYCCPPTQELLSLAPSYTLVHAAGDSLGGPASDSSIKAYCYPQQKSAHFALPFSGQFDLAAEAVSHTRNLTFLKRYLRGPYFDLEAIWEEHTYYEFEDRSVENTMNTMVEEPYVNHIPTITGGIGRADLTAFYRDHFIFSNPRDTQMELISRTVGVDRVVDEFIFKFTHNQEVDWLFPCIPPTNCYVEIPMMAVVNIRGDRLYHEHITWDHSTALKQIGCLPDSVMLSYSENSKTPTTDIRLPIAGRETVQKLRDKNSVESNGMLEDKVRHK